MKKNLEEKEFEKRKELALGSLVYKLFVKENLCLKQTSQIAGLSPNETADLLEKKFRSLNYKSDSVSERLKKEKKALDETREIYDELDRIQDEALGDSEPDDNDKSEFEMKSDLLWGLDDDSSYLNLGMRNTEKEKENSVSNEAEDEKHKEINMRNKKDEKKYPRIGFSLNTAFILAAIVAFLVGMLLMYCVDKIGSNDNYKPKYTYSATIEQEYDGIQEELFKVLAMRNNCVTELNALEDDIKTALFKYEKATEYLALYENQIAYLKGLSADVVEAIEEDNGNYSSYQSL